MKLIEELRMAIDGARYSSNGDGWWSGRVEKVLARLEQSQAERDEARHLLARLFMRSASFVTGNLGFWEGMGDVSLDNAWDRAKAWLDANPERCVHGDINPQCADHYGQP